jgi:hypothetical protein
MLAAIGSTDLYDIIRVAMAPCRARCRVLHTPTVAHLIEAARRAAVQASRGHRNDPNPCEHHLRRDKSTGKTPAYRAHDSIVARERASTLEGIA